MRSGSFEYYHEKMQNYRQTISQLTQQLHSVETLLEEQQLKHAMDLEDQKLQYQQQLECLLNQIRAKDEQIDEMQFIITNHNNNKTTKLKMLDDNNFMASIPSEATDVCLESYPEKDQQQTQIDSIRSIALETERERGTDSELFVDVMLACPSNATDQRSNNKNSSLNSNCSSCRLNSPISAALPITPSNGDICLPFDPQIDCSREGVGSQSTAIDCSVSSVHHHADDSDNREDDVYSKHSVTVVHGSGTVDQQSTGTGTASLKQLSLVGTPPSTSNLSTSATTSATTSNHKATATATRAATETNRSLHLSAAQLHSYSSINNNPISTLSRANNANIETSIAITDRKKQFVNHFLHMQHEIY